MINMQCSWIVTFALILIHKHYPQSVNAQPVNDFQQQDWTNMGSACRAIPYKHLTVLLYENVSNCPQYRLCQVNVCKWNSSITFGPLNAQLRLLTFELYGAYGHPIHMVVHESHGNTMWVPTYSQCGWVSFLPEVSYLVLHTILRSRKKCVT